MEIAAQLSAGKARAPERRLKILCFIFYGQPLAIHWKLEQYGVASSVRCRRECRF
jgi:hypothetical protein